MNWILDQILAALQRRCEHPDGMVAVDILEGCGMAEVAYCNRCGAVAIDYGFKPKPREWRRPNPNLWRGK